MSVSEEKLTRLLLLPRMWSIRLEPNFCELILYPCVPRWDSTTEVKRGKINHKSLSDLLRVETLICGAVGGGGEEIL